MIWKEEGVTAGFRSVNPLRLMSIEAGACGRVVGEV